MPLAKMHLPIICSKYSAFERGDNFLSESEKNEVGTGLNFILKVFAIFWIVKVVAFHDYSEYSWNATTFSIGKIPKTLKLKFDPLPPPCPPPKFFQILKENFLLFRMSYILREFSGGVFLLEAFENFFAFRKFVKILEKKIFFEIWPLFCSCR